MRIGVLICVLAGAAPSQTLYNGIELPGDWPPRITHFGREAIH